MPETIAPAPNRMKVPTITSPPKRATRLSAALNGADDGTKASVAAALGDAPEGRVYRRFDYRSVDVMGSGRHVYASKPKEAALPL